MKRMLRSFLVIILIFASLPAQARAAELLIPVGKVIGLQLQDDTVTVAAFDDSLGGLARDAGLKIGDEIVKVGETPVDCAQDVRCALSRGGGESEITVRRNGKLSTLQITPRQTEDGPRIGVYLRQGIAGIGTVTFYDPDTGVFGTLGHGVSSAGGTLIDMTKGCAYEASVLSVRKGKCGEPGQLKGSAQDAVCGTLLRNTPQGVFGITNIPWKGEALPSAAFEEIRTGPAAIRSTVVGDTVREYSVEIMKIYPKDRPDGRNFLLKVTDPDLLAATGGIVQGMSGSPILQDGKLVGAVTHVLVNSPDTGYGIFIGNMLDAAA
nr:SpoIVB peptidase [Oscillospiraceae bacterium]